MSISCSFSSSAVHHRQAFSSANRRGGSGVSPLPAPQLERSWVGSWDDSRKSNALASSTVLRRSDRGHRTITRMGKTAQDGPFTPIVKIVRNQIGTKDFNQLRGKGISLHSQGEPTPPVPTRFGTVWVDPGGEMEENEISSLGERKRCTAGKLQCISIFKVTNLVGTAIHAQVIKDFGKTIGAEQKQVQGLIRLAKKNGEKLGFLS